jgi:hypothetical protein
MQDTENTRGDITWSNIPKSQSENAVKENFKTNGYIQIWKNIYYSIVNENIEQTLQSIFNSNQFRFKLSEHYILSVPPNDYEKFLYLNSGIYSYLTISVCSSTCIILGYIFFAISSPVLYLYLSSYLNFFFFLHLRVLLKAGEADKIDSVSLCMYMLMDAME